MSIGLGHRVPRYLVELYFSVGLSSVSGSDECTSRETK